MEKTSCNNIIVTNNMAEEFDCSEMGESSNSFVVR